MTYKDMVKKALQQSAIDTNCSVDDLLNMDDTIVFHQLIDGRKKYYKEIHTFHVINYGYGSVIATNETFEDKAREINNHFKSYRLFDMPQLSIINEYLEPLGKCITFLAEYYLFDSSVKVNLNKEIEIDIVDGEDVFRLYEYKGFDNALTYDKENEKTDVIAAVCRINNRIVGIAGASNDCNDMWQIGIDVIAKYRKQGIAKTLVNQLANEIIKKGRVPFYCCAWSNLSSRHTALSSGFKPAWVEMTAKDVSFAKKMVKFIKEVL